MRERLVRKTDKTADGDVALREVVGALYEATLHPEILPDALRGVADLTTAHVAVRGLVGTRGQNPSVVISRGSGNWGYQLIGGAWDNPLTQGSLQYPFGTVMTNDVFLPFERVRGTPFYQRVMRPLDIAHAIGCNWLADRTIFLLTVFRSESQGRFNTAAMARYQELAPHIERATRISLQLSRAQAEKQTVLDVLYRLPIGLLIVDDEGQVHFASRAAECLLADSGSALQLRRSRLTAATDSQTRELRRLVAQAARTGAGVGVHPGGSLLAGPPDDRPLEVLVAPLPQAGLSTLPLPAKPTALVMFRSGDEPPASLLPLLRQLYGLTSAEARIAQAILQGHGLDATAKMLGIRRTTARTHLYRVFEKTGTHRQAELVRLLAGLPALLLDDPT